MIPDLKRPRLNNHHWFMVRTVGRIIFDGSVSELNDGTYGLHNALSMAAGMMDDNESVNRVEIYSSVKNPTCSGRVLGELIAVIDLNGVLVPR